MVEREDVVERRRGLTARVPEDDGILWVLVDDGSSILQVTDDTPAGRSPRNRSGIQRGSPQVTGYELVESGMVEAAGGTDG